MISSPDTDGIKDLPEKGEVKGNLKESEKKDVSGGFKVTGLEFHGSGTDEAGRSMDRYKGGISGFNIDAVCIRRNIFDQRVGDGIVAHSQEEFVSDGNGSITRNGIILCYDMSLRNKRSTLHRDGSGQVISESRMSTDLQDIFNSPLSQIRDLIKEIEALGSLDPALVGNPSIQGPSGIGILKELNSGLNSDMSSQSILDMLASSRNPAFDLKRIAHLFLHLPYLYNFAADQGDYGISMSAVVSKEEMDSDGEKQGVKATILNLGTNLVATQHGVSGADGSSLYVVQNQSEYFEQLPKRDGGRNERNRNRRSDYSPKPPSVLSIFSVVRSLIPPEDRTIGEVLPSYGVPWSGDGNIVIGTDGIFPYLAENRSGKSRLVSLEKGIGTHLLGTGESEGALVVASPKN